MNLKRLLLLLTLFLAACGGEDAPATTAPQPTATTVAAAPTVTTVPTIPPTLPPPATVAAPPTTTPLPTAVIPPTTEPTPTTATTLADGLVLVNREDFGTTRNIFTGEEVTNPDVLDRRPIACKLSNFPAQWTRPQAGLNNADILFEHVTEGRLTRFTALFYSNPPEQLGPIRSARLIDVELPAMYDAALCFSGASQGVNSKLNSSDFYDRILRSWEPGYYRTGENKPLEHTFYARPASLWNSLETAGQNSRPNPTTQMAFSENPPDGGQPVSKISMNYVSENVFWQHYPSDNRYRRWSDGVQHLDANTGQQVNFRNVVAVFAPHVDDANICEEIRNSQCVALSVEIQLWGQGRAVIFRDGLMFEGTWYRQARNDMLTFRDAAGNPIPLQLGNTMVQILTTEPLEQLTTEP
ncbi:MAG TPA: DUF3048 domain-containing protein [Anaerolineae bacterium]|nr:DUF3048 domain-containing protein [Anaerolineae bacterium]